VHASSGYINGMYKRINIMYM